MKVLGRETPNEAWYRELGKVMSRTSHPRTSVALSIRQRDLMIYQQVRRIDELERRISELQLELKQREGQQGRTYRSSRDQTDLTDQNGPSDQSEPSGRPVLVD